MKGKNVMVYCFTLLERQPFRSNKYFHIFKHDIQRQVLLLLGTCPSKWDCYLTAFQWDLIQMLCCLCTRQTKNCYSDLDSKFCEYTSKEMDLFTSAFTGLSLTDSLGDMYLGFSWHAGVKLDPKRTSFCICWLNMPIQIKYLTQGSFSKRRLHYASLHDIRVFFRNIRLMGNVQVRIWLPWSA